MAEKWLLNLSDIIFVEDENTGDVLNPRGPITDSTRMQATLRTAGQSDPIKVIKVGDKYAPTDGHTRVVAARIIGWDQIWAELESNPKTTDLLIMKMLTHNVRENPKPSFLGASYLKLMQEYSWPIEKIAPRVGLTVEEVRDHVAVASADPAIQHKVDSGEMGWSAFKEWLKKSAPVRQAIAESTDPKDVTLRGLRTKSKELREAAKPKQETLPGNEPQDEPEAPKTGQVDEIMAINAIPPQIASFRQSILWIAANWSTLDESTRLSVQDALENLHDAMDAGDPDDYESDPDADYNVRDMDDEGN